jgi:hypothetical protein
MSNPGWDHHYQQKRATEELGENEEVEGGEEDSALSYSPLYIAQSSGTAGGKSGRCERACGLP